MPVLPPVTRAFTSLSCIFLFPFQPYCGVQRDTPTIAPEELLSARDRSVTVGGWSLIIAAVLFMVVFGYLARAFNYPAVLDGQAAEVLPRLLALSATGRSVWALYGMVPLLLIPASLGAWSALAPRAPALMRTAVVFATWRPAR